jgi:hypothetical protein
MVFNFGYTQHNHSPFLRLAIGAALLWLGLNISIVITEGTT